MSLTPALSGILSDMIDFGRKSSPFLSRGMYSHHVATIIDGNIPVVINCYNHITGRCLNCHAEQHAILSYLRQNPRLRKLTKAISFQTLMTDKLMWRFKGANSTLFRIT
jgi:hypothetical protein